MTQYDILNDYFEWLCRSVSGDLACEYRHYRKLLMHLHNTQFYFSIQKDEDRYNAGIDLRWRFICERHYDRLALDELEGPCSILEMTIALAIYCEEHIMDDPGYGDRTGQWFWGMIVNLGLGAMSDDKFDRRYVDDVITRFLDRKYDPDGRGGLFRIKNCKHDLRRVEIFYQLCWYLNSLNGDDYQ